MNVRTLILGLLCAAVLFVLYPGAGSTQAPAQLPATYEVQRGDTILSIAEKICPPQATVNQVGLALARANGDKLQPRAAERLRPGSTLTVPDLATVTKTDAATAQREFNRFWRGEQHYAAGLALERSKDMFYAWASYVEAAKLGHGPAQLRLGQLYDNDLSGFVRHDLQESMRWYERARATGVQIKGPGTRTPGERPS